MQSVISNHYARIGRRGGAASTPAKRKAARLNALKRWGRSPHQVILPIGHLQDGVWYKGRGRNSKLGLWDAKATCFWTITLNDFADPASYPFKSRRKVRLKREDYFSDENGTFKPMAPVSG